MKRAIADLRTQLAGEHATCLERMLVDQVISCFLQMKYAESRAADPGPTDLNVAAFWQKRLDSAQKRYHAAVKMLATTRALLPSGLAPAGAIKVFEAPKAMTA
jgi:hypothetical protein